MKFSQVAVAAATLASTAYGKVKKRQAGNLPTVTTEGNAFWAGDERFYIRGIAYQPGGAADAQDPLLDLDTLEHDIEMFEELGINTIRIYTVDNSGENDEDHDTAMRMLDDAGIYLALDANTPRYSLNRADRSSVHMSYNDLYLESVFATIDLFGGYNNLLLFFSGNEVIDNYTNTNTAPYIKAVTRDMKRYIGAHADRRIPVGYSAADVGANIYYQARYFACGDDDNAISDFFALNDYSWCDPSSFTQSGWDQKVELYSNYTLPIFLSEFGCIEDTRRWNEVDSLYHTNMTGVYSGGLAYEFTLEQNGYGIVEEGDDGYAEGNDDYDRLAEKFSSVSMPSGDGGARMNTTRMTCPPASDDWDVADDTLLPEIPSNAEDMIQSGDVTGPGLNGTSHWGGQMSDTSEDLSDGVDESEDTSNDAGGSSSSGNVGGGSSDSDSSGADDADSGAASLSASVALVAIAVFAAVMN